MNIEKSLKDIVKLQEESERSRLGISHSHLCESIKRDFIKTQVHYLSEPLENVYNSN